MMKVKNKTEFDRLAVEEFAGDSDDPCTVISVDTVEFRSKTYNSQRLAGIFAGLKLRPGLDIVSTCGRADCVKAEHLRLAKKQARQPVAEFTVDPTVYEAELNPKTWAEAIDEIEQLTKDAK